MNISKSKSTCELQISVEIRDRTFCLIKNYDQLDYIPYRYDCNILHSWFCLHSIFKRFLHTYMTLVRRDGTIFFKSKGLYLLQCATRKELRQRGWDNYAIKICNYHYGILIILTFCEFLREKFYTVCPNICCNQTK